MTQNWNGVFESKRNIVSFGGLPMAMTSEIRIKKKRWKARIPYRIFRFAINLMDNSKLSLRGIAKKIKEIFDYNLSHVTIINWRNKYRPFKYYPKGHKQK